MAFAGFGGYSYSQGRNSHARVMEIVMKSGFTFEITCSDYTIAKDSSGKIAKLDLVPVDGEDTVAYIDPKEVALVIVKH
jgi:hypothetical protein